jgi:hypothetical protein
MEDVDWIRLAQDRGRRRAVANTVKNHRVLASRSWLVRGKVNIVRYTSKNSYPLVQNLTVIQLIMKLTTFYEWEESAMCSQ